MTDKTAFKAVLVVIAMAVILVLWGFVWPGDVWGVNWPTHAQLGWTLDSMKWVKTVDSVRTDSSGKIYNVTGWPETTFTITLGSRHEILFYYWAPGLDSGVWPWIWDLYDYNNANCIGGGAYVAALWVIDTATSPDSGVYKAKVTIKQDSSTGATEKVWWTDNNGYVEFGLDNGDWSAVASKPSLAASPIDFTIASGPHYDTIFGYVIPTPAPPTIYVATLEGYLRFASGENIVGAVITATRVEGEFATDTTSTPVIIGQKSVVARSDTAGYFSMFLYRTTAYDDTLLGTYDIVGTLQSGDMIFNVPSVPIPSSGNVNLGQIVARR